MTRCVVQLCLVQLYIGKFLNRFAKARTQPIYKTCFQEEDIFENLISAWDCQSLIVAKVGPFKKLS
jgi:hypothetical protein